MEPSNEGISQTLDSTQFSSQLHDSVVRHAVDEDVTQPSDSMVPPPSQPQPTSIPRCLEVESFHSLTIPGGLPNGQEIGVVWVQDPVSVSNENTRHNRVNMQCTLICRWRKISIIVHRNRCQICPLKSQSRYPLGTLDPQQPKWLRPMDCQIRRKYQ